jgi:hypothetical protein
MRNFFADCLFDIFALLFEHLRHIVSIPNKQFLFAGKNFELNTRLRLHLPHLRILGFGPPAYLPQLRQPQVFSLPFTTQ